MKTSNSADTIDELIGLLKEAKLVHGGDAPVRILQENLNTRRPALQGTVFHGDELQHMWGGFNHDMNVADTFLWTPTMKALYPESKPGIVLF